MLIPAQAKLKGWQPLTPSGVAAFAQAPVGRLLLVQLAAATLVAAALVWFLAEDWFPSIRAAIRHLPARSEIRAGRLDWEHESPVTLSEGHFLAFTVDLYHQDKLRLPSNIQVEFGRDSVRIYSLFGLTETGYPVGGTIPFSRPRLEPWWGAWEPPVLWITVGATIAGLMAAWMVLATVYSLPVWLTGYYANRNLSLAGSWKVAGAAMMPGALLVAAGIVLYGWGALDLVEWILLLCAHVLVGWLYLVVSPLCAPRLPSPAGAGKNPFTVSGDGRDRPRGKEA